MKFRRRPMQPGDVEKCLELITDHPDFTLQYGGQTQLLRKVLQQLLGSDGFLARIFEVVDGDEVKLLGLGGIVFLTEEFVARAKKPPHFWIAPELMRELLGGKQPHLSDLNIKADNSSEGLTVYSWPLGFRHEYLLLPEFMLFLLSSFLEELRGYKIREYLGQATEVEGTRATMNSGAILLTSRGRFSELPAGEEELLLSNPHLMVITREQALKHPGSWSSALFMYNPPIIGFSRSEQRLLEQALRGAPDEEVATTLKISLSAVKKAWRSVYDRVERSGVGILPSGTEEVESGDRGKGKKHRLLAYVREHPEELRPISMKALRKAQGQRGGGGLAGGEAMPRRRVVRARP
jgi:DNA-binding CsgD family transcriptional regulator